ncbi:hypothetical protein A8C75_19935 [Marinobacterium aestuarii]|uniref:Uncharacterized protein n=1 Tax=Marinobacterium aestuarii TaxID=1821621 RepID=A0A1A9F2I2_9GAMM|nr:hypothetical protein [Marinobacterium aestuarii]ANG64514.1 hypothetical protein A8C75_19935 [Marinobacterium aestuarii]
MGYLADIVADARERHLGESAPAYSEEVLEVSLAGENPKPSTTPDNNHPGTPSLPIEQSPDTLDSAKSQAPDLPPTREQRPEPASAKDTHDAAAQQSAQAPLHQYLKHLSQQTLVARSEEILTRQQSPSAPTTAKTDANPTRAAQQKPSSGGHENTPIPAAKINTDTQVDSSDKSAVPPVQDKQPAPPPAQTTIRTTQEGDTRTTQDSQDPHPHRPLHRDAAKNINRDQQSPPAAAHTPIRQHTSAPPRSHQALASGAPQLRIGQINVVVESTKPDQDRRSGLERESDSGSRYFLRSL